MLVSRRQALKIMGRQHGQMRSRSAALRTFMRRNCRVLALAALLLPVAVPASSGLAGQPAPDFALKSIAGANLRLSEYRGQVVLISFWAQWCNRCTEQLSMLSELQKRYGDANLRILAVNIDPDDQAARETAGRLNITVLHDADQSVVREYDPSVLPFAVLVDPHGTVRQVHAGYRAEDAVTFADELAALILE